MTIRFFYLPLLFLCLFCSFLAAESPTVLVTLSPYRHLVEKVAGDTVRIEVLVPPGTSTHTYSPSPSQVVAIGKADLWFRIGEVAEEQTMRAIRSHSSHMQVIDLRKGIDLISDESHAHCCGNGHDPHIWLSAKMLRPQVETITDTLIRIQPDQEDLYLQNARTLLLELDNLDRELARTLKNKKGQSILVGHPAFGYLCRDYGLVQMAIEHEGKDPHPRRLTELIRDARQLKIRYIFVQPQHSAKGAEQIAAALGAKIIEIDPNREEVLENLREIAHAFSQ
jgi:zinc transport system substrate-binding protein